MGKLATGLLALNIKFKHWRVVSGGPQKNPIASKSRPRRSHRKDQVTSVSRKERLSGTQVC